MTPERWRRIEDVYHAALERGSGERVEFLAVACGADSELKREVDSLLAENGSRAGMIDGSPIPVETIVGSQFGPYRIEASIGKGGMGEVWKARDSRLNRDVAIKISAQQFSGRFEREARAIAALNHSNICTLYDVGPNYLVMELVEGPTLAERIRRGPIPTEEALAIAKQIADALEAAHEKGIVHRDLKPANIKIRTDGSVKVLDFGLAKASEGSAITSETQTMTTPGTVMGTPGYMPPEQVRGENVDKRADIWAFGVVLYEMVTGQRPFEGKTVSDTLASVMKEEPDWARAPAKVRKLLRRCLQKDSRLRLRDIGDAAALLEESPGPPAISRGRPGWVVAALCAFAAGGAVFWWLKPAPPVAHVVTRFKYPLPEGQSFTRKGRHDIALSPDGARLVYVANQQLYLRAMDQLDAQPIRGTNEDPSDPVFSPDGQWLAYFAPAGASASSPFVLRKIAVSGGAPVTLGQLAAAPYGATWRNGTIAFGMNSGSVASIQAVPESGGTPQTIVNGDPKMERMIEPQLLADGKNVLFVSVSVASSGTEGQIVVQIPEGKDGKAGKDRRTLVNTGTDPRVLPTGQLVYVHGATLLAVPFDFDRLAVTGGPVPIIENFTETSTQSAGQFSVSLDGTLAFTPGAFAGIQRTLVWVDREGHEQPIPAKARAYDYPRLSPDGTKIAVSSADDENDIWVFDLAKETLTRLTFGPAFELYAAWTPNNKYLLFSSGPFGSGTGGHVDIFRKAADGTGAMEPLTQNLGGGYPESVSPDGKSLLFKKQIPSMGLFLLPLDPKGEARPLLADPKFSEPNGEISPDGRWIAYQSNESGRAEIYVRPFPAIDSGRWQISSEGGMKPLWSRSGRELFFATPANRMAAVPVPPGAAFTYGKPRPLFDAAAYLISTAASGRMFDISPDGKRFLMIKPVGTDSTARPSIVIVTHWFDEVKARMPGK